METAESVIDDALQEILVQASEQSIQTADFQRGRRYLNRMMAVTPFVGLGFTTITNPTDLVTVPDAALEGIIFNLAKRLLTSYDMPISTELNMNAETGIKEIRRLTVNITPTSMPCTLPFGSGNEEEGAYTNFYACPEDEISTEQGGAIIQEANT